MGIILNLLVTDNETEDELVVWIDTDGDGDYETPLTDVGYTITVNASPTAGGTVSGGGSYNGGKTVTLKATANSGYRFVRWREDGAEVSTDASYTFTAGTDRTLTAVFEAEPVPPVPTTYTVCTVIVNASPTVGGTVSGGGSYDENASVTVTATAPSGYHFVRWTENGKEVSTKATYTFKVMTDTTLTAVFEKDSEPPAPTTYTVTVNVSPTAGGSVSSGGTYDEGESVTVTAAANSGYRFVGWTEDGTTVSTEATYTFTVGADRTLTAVFSQISSGGGGGSPSYQITTSTTANGTMTVTPTSAKSGAEVTITATPNDGYQVDSVTVKDSSGMSIAVTDNGDGTYTFIMPSSKVTVEVTFADIHSWFNPFTDVFENNWFYDGVAYVAQNGLMIGVGNQQFNPYGTTSRGMIVTILYRLEGKPAVSQSTFADVAVGQYYTDAVAWAAANKIVEGYGTLGNRPDLFLTSEYPNASVQEDYLDYDVPPEALEDEVFAAMLIEAEKYLGFPYVWGGTNPSTSFDCSGYVSWVINHSGWNYERLGVTGLEDVCTPVSSANARPGDLVFFIGTYDAPYPDRPSHVGIYVGNGMMIHCGSPISYANINTPYWQDHFYGFGRLREP